MRIVIRIMGASYKFYDHTTGQFYLVYNDKYGAIYYQFQPFYDRYNFGYVWSFGGRRNYKNF